jgi:hypothetical protein
VSAIRKLTSVFVFLAVLGTGACASPETTESDPTAKPESGAPSSEDITFGEQLAQIRGHHLAATELYEADDTKGAATHTGHPVEELLAAVRSEVAEHDDAVADRLEPALKAPSQVVADGGSTDELATAMAEATEVVEDAESAVVGEKLTTTAYRASVIAALLATVGHEYEEAVQDGELKLEAEYQDAYAFATYAKQQYDDIAGDVREAAAEEADEIDEDFETLAAALPGVEPPSELADNADVVQAATHVGAELAESVDAVLLETVSAEDAFANINGLLDEILEAYEARETEEAAELVAEAYLENYELIEADVIEHAPNVNAELEPLLGAQLRAQINEGASLSEIESMVDEIRRLLGQAEEALAGVEGDEAEEAEH